VTPCGSCKNRYFLQEPHCGTSQETAFFIFTAVRTSNLTRRYFLFICGLEWNRVSYCGHLLAHCTSPGWWIVMIMERIAEWMSGRGNRSTRKKHVPVPFCTPQFPHDLTQARIWPTSVGSRRLTSWVMARPVEWYIMKCSKTNVFQKG
jgi:hypothetical protein